jgi:subtilase family serine protease
VTVEPANLIQELDETNNTLDCPTFTLAGSPRPDMVITGVETTVTPVNTTTDWQWRVTVRNQGAGPARFTYPNLVLSGGMASNYVYPPGDNWTLAAGASHTFTVGRHSAFNPGVGTHTVTFTVDPGGRVVETDETNNTFTYTLTVIEAPPPPPVDLVPTACRVTPDAPSDDARVWFYVTIENQGTATAVFPSNYVGAIALSGGNYAGVLNGGLTIPAGESREVYAYWMPFSHPPGTYSITVTVEPANLIQELDETNNTLVCPTFTLAESPRPDMVITAVETTVTPVDPTTDWQWRVTVRNQGAAPATFTYPNLVLSGGMASNYVYPPGDSWTLAAGASRTFTVGRHSAFNPGVGTHTVTFTVDPGGRVVETDETNNTFTYTLTVIEAP